MNTPPLFCFAFDVVWGKKQRCCSIRTEIIFCFYYINQNSIHERNDLKLLSLTLQKDRIWTIFRVWPSKYVSASRQCLDRQIEYSKGSLAEQNMLLSHDFNIYFAIRRNLKCCIIFRLLSSEVSGWADLTQTHQKTTNPGGMKYIYMLRKNWWMSAFCPGQENYMDVLRWCVHYRCLEKSLDSCA